MPGRRDRDADPQPLDRSAWHQAIHGTAIAFPADTEGPPPAVLLRGPSGAGKSDLALRLIDSGTARLIADDRVAIAHGPAGPVLSAPAAIRGKLEVRGLGIVPQDGVAAGRLALIVDLVARAAVERLPAPRFETVAGHAVPRLSLHGFDLSTPAKIRLALRLIADGTGDVAHALAAGGDAA